MAKKEIYDIAVKLLAETNLAWRLTDGAKTEWFPKSQCELSNESSGAILTAPIWLLKAKGFI